MSKQNQSSSIQHSFDYTNQGAIFLNNRFIGFKIYGRLIYFQTSINPVLEEEATLNNRFYRMKKLN